MKILIDIDEIVIEPIQNILNSGSDIPLGINAHMIKAIANGTPIPDDAEVIDKYAEQEPCDDAISREELLKAISTWDKFGCDANTKLVPYQDHYIPYIHYDDVIKCIKGMPPVRPQEPKTGHWIYDDECKEHGHCSCCGYGSVDLVDGEPHIFCRNCGAKMVEPQESEDKG